MTDRGSPAALAFTFSCAAHIAAVAALVASLLADPGVPFILEPPCDPLQTTRPTLMWAFASQPRTAQPQAAVFDPDVETTFDVEVSPDPEQVILSELIPGISKGVEGGICGCGGVGGIVGGLDSELPQIGLLVDVQPYLPATPLRVYGATALGKVFDVAPKYPPLARQARIEGVVVIDATIDERGHVVGVELLRSIPVFDRAATDAVRQWRYAPAVVNGHPVSVVMTVTVVFSLQGQGANHSPNRAV